MRCRSRSMSRTLTLTSWLTCRTSDGWLMWVQDSSEMWMRPSMPSRSTKAPKSTMFEIVPVTMSPTLSSSMICWRTSLRSSSRTARRRQHDVVAVAVHLDDAAGELLADVLREVLHAADVDERGGQEAAHAEVEDETALDDLDDRALHRHAAFVSLFDALPGLFEAGPLLGQDQAPVGVFFLHDEGVDLLAELHLVGGVHRLADRELADGDDAFGLVADVDQDLVLVDAHHGAGDDVALAEDVDGEVVVGDDLPVDLGKVALALGDDLGVLGGDVDGSCFLRILCHIGRLPSFPACVAVRRFIG